MSIECCVCLEEKKCLNIQCKHPLCKDCFERLIQKSCPLCRRNIIILENKLKKFFNILVEILFFILIVSFAYYTETYVFINNNKNWSFYKRPDSNIELFLNILQLVIDIIEFINK